MRVRLRATATAAVCSVCIAASVSVPTIQTLSASPEQHRTVSTQAYVLTSNDGTLSPASIGSLAALPGVTTAAAPTPPEGSTWPSANPLVNLAVGPLQFDPKFSRSPVLASPFTIVNAPFQLLTGQSIVNPNGTTSAPTVQNLINAETTALGLLAGVPAAYVANTIAVVQAIVQNPGSLLPSGLSVPTATTLSAANTTAVSPTTKTLASTAVTAAATPTAPAGSTWPSTNPVVNLLVGPLQFNSKWQSPVLASPFTIVNAPFQLLTGQSIVNPDGTTVAPTVQNFIAAETKAFGLLVGLPGAYVANTIAVVTALSQNPGSILPSGLIQPTATTTANPTVAKTAALSLPESPTTATSATTNTLAAPTASAPTASAPTAAATPTAPAGSTWPSTNPVVNLLVGPLQFNSKWQSPVLASPFTIVNAPFQLLTGQSIVNPDGTTSAPTIQNLINAEAKAFGLLVGLPGAYVSNTIAVVTALTQNPASLLPAGLSAPAATTTATGVKAPTSILSALGKTSTTAAKIATTEQKTAVEGTKAAESKATTSKSSPEAEPAKAGAAKPANPAEAVTPAEPAKSATPAEPVKAAEPAKPATPADAATPAEPAKPATAADAAAKPVDAAKPAEPKVNVPKVKLPTPVTKVGEVSGGVTPKADDSAKADKSEKTDSKTDKADKGSTPKKPEKDSSSAKKPEAAASSSTKSESGSSSSSSDSHAGSSNGSSSSGSSHSDSHKAS
ncbi:Hypothetical protein ERS075564_02232 [Mycobacteroides abscessus]|uniref:Uncharacterized protein n=2 Tax=Mycobacteroides abscessus TaxID=36809 RepID=A0AB38DL66_9MYCO|nr:hypothetical protein MASS_0962 [Mycobacteroides abscessus subsp. bolletii 50594]MBE5469358.1 hypothetical protein [Mycobacteroides abscessus]SKD43602.1 Uncharacterised protein [Mycobacteroides abscessus subsp. massiliense]MBE5479319.1 hypothetical protein [Mycobacteroides abscessus]PVA70231.1 hypothetical protein DDJ87_02660 [Mycobacteroides abscessus]